jgi:hypothetical protein
VSGVDMSANPEVVKRTVTLDDLKQKLNALENTQKEFEHWKRVEVDGKKKMRIFSLSNLFCHLFVKRI